MARYINADELKNYIKDQLVATVPIPASHTPTYGETNIMEQIDAVPTVRVGLKTGHWIKNYGGKYVCSNCGMDALFDNTTCMVASRYCPSCGMWMCEPIVDLTERQDEQG